MQCKDEDSWNCLDVSLSQGVCHVFDVLKEKKIRCTQLLTFHGRSWAFDVVHSSFSAREGKKNKVKLWVGRCDAKKCTPLEGPGPRDKFALPMTSSTRTKPTYPSIWFTLPHPSSCAYDYHQYLLSHPNYLFYNNNNNNKVSITNILIWLYKYVIGHAFFMRNNHYSFKFFSFRRLKKKIINH